MLKNNVFHAIIASPKLAVSVTQNALMFSIT